jgi:Ti-type conjugative transfer relaxase TraA
MLHVSVRNADGENLTDEQWLHVADRMEAKLGLSEQKRGIVLHINEETGDAHMHIGWSLVDEETSTLKRVPFYIVRLREICRDMEREFGLRVLDNDRNRSQWIPTEDEYQQAKRLGVNLNEVRDSIRDCWERSDNGRSFQVALEYEGLHLGQGDRRDFVVVDQAGGVHALGRRILGVSAADVRARLQDIDRESLPTVEEIRHEQRTGMRDQHAANLAWEDALADAAILKEKLNPQFDAAPRFSMDQYEQLAPVVLDDLTKNRATFTRYDIQRALEPHIENKLDREGLAGSILEHPDVIRLDAGKGRAARYTTASVLESEGHALRVADALADHDWHGVPTRLAAEKLHGLSGEKADALRHILGPEGLAILDGQAGTGKSTVLAAGKEIYEADGCRVIGLAHTNLVVQDLKGRGFDARTIDSELYSLANGRTQWTARTVVMVDEAAMVDTRRLGMIFAHAQESGAKVVLAGDDRQLSSIERGGLFEVLKARYGAAELIDVRRQNATDERAASQAMARGDFAGALATYSNKGAIHWTERQSEAATVLVQKYMQDSADNPLKTRFIFTHRNTEVDQINAVVREARKARYELGESATFETKHGRTEFAPGDRLQFTGTDKQRGIYNGQAGTVKEIEGSRFIVELDGRKKAAIAFDAAAFKDFRHGYAGTIYRGQGRTIDQTYLYHSEHWRNATSYVALTRHSDKTELFVARETAADLPELARQMSRLDQRRAASYYAPQNDREARPMTSAELTTWYANQDNCARQIRAQRVDANHADKSDEIRYNVPTRNAAQKERVLSDLGRSDQAVRRAFANAATSAVSNAGRTAGAIAGKFANIANVFGGITSLIAGDQPRSPEDVRARRDAALLRAAERQTTAARKRGYGREMETQARERAEREEQEQESQRKRRNDRQR